MAQGSAARGDHSKADRAYLTIKDRIESGGYGPGYRLVLDRIAHELAVSPVPVREALRRLEAEGYVVFERNLGARVATIDPDQYGHAMEVLAVVEGAATAAAAPHLTRDQIAAARELNQRMRDSMVEFDPAAFTELNQRFHELLCGACPNPHLRGVVEREWKRLGIIRRSSFVFARGRPRASVREHDKLLDLIESGAPAEEIERLSRAHKLATLDAVLGTTGRNG